MAGMAALLCTKGAVLFFCGMAAQIGSLRLKGTIAGICFYRMYGRYYARKKSSLTGKRVKRDPAFARTMYYAGLLGKASMIASERYKRVVPKEERSRKKYHELVGVVMHELREVNVLSKRTRDVRKYNVGLLCNTGRKHELQESAQIKIDAMEEHISREKWVTINSSHFYGWRWRSVKGSLYERPFLFDSC
jgi:hypothetical protein